MTHEKLAEIRHKTRIALPDDDTYLYRLGVALYGFASINSFMTEIICNIDKSQDRNFLLDKTSGRVLKVFKDVLKNIIDENKYFEIHHVMSQTAELFEKLKNQRDDFVHAYPITNMNNEQILHRRKDKDNKYFEVDN